MPLPECLYRNGLDWKLYLERVHRVYLDTIARAYLQFDGWPVRQRFFPSDEGKAFTFWHMVTTGDLEAERTPDEKRCERIGWVAWTIANAKADPSISWWENTRRSNTNVVLWLPDQSYAVILSKRTGYYVLTSAYEVKEHRRADFERERSSYWANKSKSNQLESNT